ncbi:helicase associated domain-containing protein [Kitasatospora sp. SC0581]|uniref:helicase associated domain-containing protein n=1 Tax=Kitasatospora sp. SC0581 TaxID=3394360 RepID=UPI003A88C4BD
MLQKHSRTVPWFPEEGAAEATGAAARKAGAGKPGAFDCGPAALARYKARTGSATVPRGHVEPVPEGGGTAEVKLGTLLSNAESRRAKPTGERSERLAALGLD